MKRGLVLLACSVALGAAADERKSGTQFMGASTQAMQRDDTQNPAMLWMGDGEALWQARAGENGKSCASCHGGAKTSMRGVAASFPAFDTPRQLPINLGQRINRCREGKQQLPPWRAESRELLAIESYVALQSRGMPVKPGN